MPTFQVIAYPIADQLDRWPSYKERGTGYILDRQLMEWYFKQYLPENWSSTDPYLFPLAAQDFSSLPSSLVLTAEFDPLRDEGVAYAHSLQRAGVHVEHIHAHDQMHGFLLLGALVANAADLILRVADTLASLCEPETSCKGPYYEDVDGHVHILL
jgi:acetyl esterase